MKAFALLAALAPTAIMANGAVELTKLNFEENTKNKNAFVKFLAPW